MFMTANIDVDNGHNINWFAERIKDFVSNQVKPILDSATFDDEPVFTQFKHNAKAAIKALSKEGRGVAIAALYHKDIGDIDLRWGETSDDFRAKGHGLAKIIKWHPEVLQDLQGFISSLKVHQTHQKKHEIDLTDEKDSRAGEKIGWNNKTNHWLITAYIKPNKASASKGTPAALDNTLEPTTATSNITDNSIIDFENCEINQTLDSAATPIPLPMKLTESWALQSYLRGLRAASCIAPRLFEYVAKQQGEIIDHDLARLPCRLDGR